MHRFASMKLLTVLFAIAATFSLGACCTGIVERKVPAKSCCAADDKNCCASDRGCSR